VNESDGDFIGKSHNSRPTHREFMTPYRSTQASLPSLVSRDSSSSAATSDPIVGHSRTPGSSSQLPKGEPIHP